MHFFKGTGRFSKRDRINLQRGRSKTRFYYVPEKLHSIVAGSCDYVHLLFFCQVDEFYCIS